MKHFKYILVLFVALSLQACLASSFDVEFHEENGIVVPADGGIYYFQIEAVETKTSFTSSLRRFKYRVIIDDEVIDQQFVGICLYNQHIKVGEQWKIEFSVPENVTSAQRAVRVEVIREKDICCSDDPDSFDPGNNSWETIWEAKQLSRSS